MIFIISSSISILQKDFVSSHSKIKCNANIIEPNFIRSWCKGVIRIMNNNFMTLF